jgi:HEAT repeat protein
MDPYLENPEFFPGLHDRLINELSADLQKSLPPAYYAEIRSRVWVEYVERRGVTLSAALIASALWGRLATAAVQVAVAGASITALSRIAGVTAGRAVRTFLLTGPQVALGLLAVVCLAGSGVGVACYGAAKQVSQTPPSAGAHQQAAAPGHPAEPPKGAAPVPIDPKLIAKLAEQLRSKNFEELTAALTALEELVPAKGAGKMDFGPVIEPLFDNSGWGGPGWKEAHRAEELIVRIGVQAAPTLRRRLGSSDAHDRRVAAELVARVEPPSPALTELLRPLLADRDRFVRRAAIQGLGAQGPAAKEAISDLEKESADPIRTNRVMACVALIHIAGPSEKRVGALADLLLLRKNTEDNAAAYAASELSKLGQQAHSAAPQLLAALKYPDVRYAAAYALGPVGADPDKAVPALLAMLKDETERERRRTLAVSLGEFGPAAASALPALREALRGEGGGWWVAAEAIGKIGGPDAVPALVEALQNKNEDVRGTAIQWLGKLDGADASTIEALKKAQKDDPQERNRKYAAEALKKITARPSPDH